MKIQQGGETRKVKKITQGTRLVQSNHTDLARPIKTRKPKEEMGKLERWESNNIPNMGAGAEVAGESGRNRGQKAVRRTGF